MSSDYSQVLQQKKMFLEIKAQLIRKARTFYAMGFNHRNLMLSQMMAVNDRLNALASIDDAKKDMSLFIEHQLEKLRAKEKRSGKKKSWLIDGHAQGLALGEILIEWVSKEKYTEGLSSVAENDKLIILRRFWDNVVGLHRYEKVFGKGMPLQEDKLI